MREGFFRDLPGSGSPLVFEDETFVPEDLRMAFRVLKNAGFAPPELELKKEIINLKELINTIDDDEARLRKIRELNMKLMRLSILLNRPANLDAYEDQIINKFIS